MYQQLEKSRSGSSSPQCGALVDTSHPEFSIMSVSGEWEKLTGEAAGDCMSLRGVCEGWMIVGRGQSIGGGVAW